MPVSAPQIYPTRSRRDDDISEIWRLTPSSACHGFVLSSPAGRSFSIQSRSTKLSF